LTTTAENVRGRDQASSLPNYSVRLHKDRQPKPKHRRSGQKQTLYVNLSRVPGFLKVVSTEYFL